jgi:hypothetical protein
MSRDQTSALIVSSNNIVKRIKLDVDFAFPGADDTENDFPCSSWFISKSGTQWAFLCYGTRKRQVQLIGLTSGGAPSRRLDLTWPPCNDPKALLIAMSPDLHVLTVNANVFSIANPDDYLASSPFTLKDCPEFFERYWSEVVARRSGTLQCCISGKLHSIVMNTKTILGTRLKN